VSDEKKDEELPPFVQNDDSANLIAIHAARRRASYAATMLWGTGFAAGPPLLWGGSGEGNRDLAEDAVAWVALRAEIIPKLDAVEGGLRTIAPVIENFERAYREQVRIGHNNPPEVTDILPIDLAELELGIVAANLARKEINAEQPRSDVMRFCGLVLRRTGELLAACVKWIGSKGDVYVEEFLKESGRESGKRAVQVVAATVLFEQLHVDLHDVVTKIVHVFELLHLPF
jgi:hypothetical protein